MSDVRELLAGIEKRADAATPGPWDVSNANEGMYEYGPFWMITNDEFHNPSGDEDAPWLAVEIHTGDKGDAEFIAHARTAVPALVAALRAVLDMHRPDYGIPTGCDTCNTGVYPCETVRAITEALGGAW